MKARFVYMLSNPINQQPFYIGVTSELKLRRRQHYKKFSAQFNGMPPVFTVIDVIRSYGFWVGLAIERYWINKYKHDGADLINKRNANDKYFDINYDTYRKAVIESNVLNYRNIPLTA